MKEFIHEEKHDEWGYYCEYRFPNGYGAVVVQNPSTYGVIQGKFEIAHTIWVKNKDWEYAQMNIFGNRDYEGHIQMLDISAILQLISELPIDN